MRRNLGYRNDLTAQFVRLKRPAEPEDVKSKFLVRKGVLQGIAPDSESPRPVLRSLPTKASSGSEGHQSDDSIELRQQPTRQLPPLYVDIQEEIEANLLEIDAQSKRNHPKSIVKELRRMQQRRIKEAFFEDD